MTLHCYMVVPNPQDAKGGEWRAQSLLEPHIHVLRPFGITYGTCTCARTHARKENIKNYQQDQLYGSEDKALTQI